MNPGLAPTVTPGVLRYVSNRLTLLFNDYLISSTNPTTHTSTIQNNIELGRGPTQSLQTYTKMSVIYSLSCLGVCLCGQSRHQSDRWAGAVYWSRYRYYHSYNRKCISSISNIFHSSYCGFNMYCFKESKVSNIPDCRHVHAHVYVHVHHSLGIFTNSWFWSCYSLRCPAR